MKSIRVFHPRGGFISPSISCATARRQTFRSKNLAGCRLSINRQCALCSVLIVLVHCRNNIRAIGFQWSSGSITSVKAFMKRSLPRLLLLLCVAMAAHAQDWIRTGTGLGVEKVRVAVPDFKPSGSDPQTAALLKTFNDTLWNDLDNAGIFDMVSKSFYPLQVPGTQQEMRLPD